MLEIFFRIILEIKITKKRSRHIKIKRRDSFTITDYNEECNQEIPK